MVSQNSYDGIDKYAADLIRHKARQLVGKAGFTEDDRPDLEQELMIDLLGRMMEAHRGQPATVGDRPALLSGRNRF